MINIKLKGDYLTINNSIAGKIDEEYITLVSNNRLTQRDLRDAKVVLEGEGYIVEIKNQ